MYEKLFFQNTFDKLGIGIADSLFGYMFIAFRKRALHVGKKNKAGKVIVKIIVQPKPLLLQ